MSNSSVHADQWTLDPAVAMLNHGSFGACPRAVLQVQQQLREKMEQRPMRFFARQMQPLLDESRRTLAAVLGADPCDVVFVRNTTGGVNSVLRSLRFAPGDELLLTDHGYNACRNVADFVAQRSGARVVVAEVPAPVQSPRQVVEAVMARVTDRTRLAMIDHVSSPTAVVFPVGEIVSRLDRQGVDTLVDGAHGPGMLPLSMKQLGAAYYTGTCHKWLCSPKGAGFLYVRPDRQAEIQPAAISHGYNTPRPQYSRFQDAFDWVGTDDPTPWLCVGEAIRFLGNLVDGGLEGLIERNRQLALRARRLLCQRFGLAPTCPEEMIGSLAAMRLPDDPGDAASASATMLDTGTAVTPTHRMQCKLAERYGIDVPIYHWPAAPQKLLRISAQAYNSLDQYERLATAIGRLIAAGV